MINNKELQEKKEKVYKEAEDTFPEGEWFLEVVQWEDNSFRVRAIHNRTTLETKWKVMIVACSEKHHGPEEPTSTVEFTNKNIERFVVFSENKEIYA